VLAQQFAGQLGVGGARGDPNVYFVADQWLRQAGP